MSTTAPAQPLGAAERSGPLVPGEAPVLGASDRLPARGRRWRLLLGEVADEVEGSALGLDEQRMDQALAELYEADQETGPSTEEQRRRVPTGTERRGGLGSSAPRVARWLGDIRTYFPSSVVQVLQRDAVDRLNLTSLLLEPELLEAVQPDVHLVSALLSLHRVMPETTQRTAREVVARVVRDIERRIAQQTRSAALGALQRAQRTSRPRPGDIDWNATIARNLRHYLPEFRTVVPQQLVGRTRGAPIVARQVVVAVDQSGSMAESLVYAAVFAASLASVRALRTSVVVFDTEVVDLTAQVEDPVELLFSCHLGGGTDIERALRYCAQLIDRPTEAVLVLISDLFDGGPPGGLLRRIRDLVDAGVSVMVLLALSDEGTPAYDHEQAAAVADLGVPVFACTPDRFADLMAVALARGDLRTAASQAQAGEGAK